MANFTKRLSSNTLAAALGFTWAGLSLAGQPLPVASSSAIEPISPAEPLIESPERPKKWRLKGGLSFAATYDDNVLIRPSQKSGDFVFTSTPTLSLALGDLDAPSGGSLTLSYAAGVVYYAEHSSEDAINHSILLDGEYRFSRLTVGVKVGFHKTNEANAEVGARVETTSYSAALSSSYELTDLTSIEMHISRSSSAYSGFLDTSDILAQTYLNYKATSTLTLSVGAAYGQTEAQGSSARPYEQATFRAVYTPSEMLSFSANVGADIRETFDGDTAIVPIFGLTATYQPFDSTKISLNGSRSVQPSVVFLQQEKDTTSLGMSIQQRFLQRYYLMLGAGYDYSEFRGAAESETAGRTDNAFSLRLGATTNITDRWSVELFGQHRRNSSSFGAFSFTDNQIGLSTSLSF